MAEPVKVGSRYRHSIMVGGKRLNDTFDTKKEARTWEAETRLLYKQAGVLPEAHQPKHTMAEAFDLYNSTISALKKNAVRREANLLNSFLPFFAGRNLEDITTADIARWRDHKLLTVQGSTVLRYRNLLGNVFSIARDEWKWIKESPMRGVKWPKENSPRGRVWRWHEIKRVLREGQRRGGKYHEVTQAFRISLFTAMRLKEALAAPGNLNLVTKVATIHDRKESRTLNPVKIPLLKGSIRSLRQTPASFEVEANEASVLFSKLLSQMGIKGLQYKDSRATALTLMAKRVPIEVLQRISRHKDANILTAVYYRESAEEISSRF